MGRTMVEDGETRRRHGVMGPRDAVRVVLYVFAFNAGIVAVGAVALFVAFTVAS